MRRWDGGHTDGGEAGGRANGGEAGGRANGGEASGCGAIERGREEERG